MILTLLRQSLQPSLRGYLKSKKLISFKRFRLAGHTLDRCLSLTPLSGTTKWLQMRPASSPWPKQSSRFAQTVN